jgi:hypothetical protein
VEYSSHEFSKHTVKRKCKYTHNVNGQYGMNPTGHYVVYAHMFEEEGRKRNFYPNDNRDFYKEEINIPPPYPHKRKNIYCFSHTKDPYFLYPPE